MTFGFAPPDSSSIALVSDPRVCARADDALNSVLGSSGGTIDTTYRDNGSLYVYRAGPLFALTDASRKDNGNENIAPFFFFFSSDWKYLGERSR